jgi:hypothetical protein
MKGLCERANIVGYRPVTRFDSPGSLHDRAGNVDGFSPG